MTYHDENLPITLLNEDYHRRTDFNEALDSIAIKIAKIVDNGCAFAFGSQQSKDFLDKIKGKLIKSGYQLHLTILDDNEKIDRSTKFKIELEKTDEDIDQIVLNIIYDELSWLFSCELKQISENNYYIIISCNMISLENLYLEKYNLYATYKDKLEIFNDFKNIIKNKIAHELNGHAIQEIGKILHNSTNNLNNKIDLYNSLINDLSINEDEKELLTTFFYYFTPSEINARLTEIDYTANNLTKKEIMKASGYDIEILNNKTIINCLSLLSKYTKLDIINSIYNLIIDKNLLQYVYQVNKQVNFFKTNDIFKTIKNYEIMVLKQIYKVLHDDLHYGKNSDIITEQLSAYNFFNCNVDNFFKQIK